MLLTISQTQTLRTSAEKQPASARCPMWTALPTSIFGSACSDRFHGRLCLCISLLNSLLWCLPESCSRWDRHPASTDSSLELSSFFRFVQLISMFAWLAWFFSFSDLSAFSASGFFCSPRLCRKERFLNF